MRAKRAVTFLSLFIISCILLTGCSKPVNPFKEESTFVPDSAEDKQIEFSLEVIPYFPEEMRRDDMVMYSLTNNSDTEYETGGYCTLEYYYDGEWYVVPHDSNTSSKSGIILTPGKKCDQTILLNSLISRGLKLPEGHYRIIKPFLRTDRKGTPEEANFQLAFELDYPLPGKYIENDENDMDVDELSESTTEITPLEELNLEITYEGDIDGTLTFNIINNSDVDYLGGDTYILEYEDDGKWYTVPLRKYIAFSMIGILINKNSTREFKIRLPIMHSGLIAGHYRVIKDLSEETYTATDPLKFKPRESKNIAFEFDYPF